MSEGQGTAYDMPHKKLTFCNCDYLIMYVHTKYRRFLRTYVRSYSVHIYSYGRSQMGMLCNLHNTTILIIVSIYTAT